MVTSLCFCAVPTSCRDRFFHCGSLSNEASVLRAAAGARALLIGICFLAAQPPRWGFNYCEPGSESSRNGLHYGSLTFEGFDRLWRRRCRNSCKPWCSTLPGT